MKKKLLKIAIFTLFVSQTINIANAQSISKSSGAPTPLQNEFSSATWNYPTQISGRWRGVYNDSRINRMFVETLRLKVPKGCKVVKANFQIRVKNLGAQNYNDSLYMLNGGTNLFGQKVWTNEPQGATKLLSYNLANLPTGGSVISRPSASILHTLNDGKFSFFVQDDTSVQSVKLDYQLRGRRCGGNNGGGKYQKGMTWGKRNIGAVSGVIEVGCWDSTGAKCEPYHGDTMCSIKRPILCINTSINSAPKPAWVSSTPKHRFVKGVIATSRPVSPAQAGLNTLTKANNYCRNAFGSGWKVANFHQGDQWNFKSYGNVGSQSKRFWVNIKDQVSGNCWSQQ